MPNQSIVVSVAPSGTIREVKKPSHYYRTDDDVKWAEYCNVAQKQFLNENVEFLSAVKLYKRRVADLFQLADMVVSEYIEERGGNPINISSDMRKRVAQGLHKVRTDAMPLFDEVENEVLSILDDSLMDSGRRKEYALSLGCCCSSA